MRELYRQGVDALKFLLATMTKLEGPERSSGEPLVVLWSGPDTQLGYIQRRLFQDGKIRATELGRYPLPRVDRLLAAERCDLAVIAADRRWLGLIRQDDDLMLPWWIECDIHIAEAIGGTVSRSLKRDMREIEKNGLATRPAANREELELFYRSIYLPTIRRAHGEAALPSDAQKRYEQVGQGLAEVLLVTAGAGEVLGGILIDYRNECPALRDVGVINGDPEIKRKGVVTAANLAALELLASRGHKRVSFGMSRPFLDDGPLVYKRKWRARVCGATSDRFLFRVGSLGAATRALMLRSSCIAFDDSGLQRHFFFDGREISIEDAIEHAANDWDFGILSTRLLDASGSRIAALSTEESLRATGVRTTPHSAT